MPDKLPNLPPPHEPSRRSWLMDDLELVLSDPEPVPELSKPTLRQRVADRLPRFMKGGNTLSAPDDDTDIFKAGFDDLWGDPYDGESSSETKVDPAVSHEHYGDYGNQSASLHDTRSVRGLALDRRALVPIIAAASLALVAGALVGKDSGSDKDSAKIAHKSTPGAGKYQSPVQVGETRSVPNPLGLNPVTDQPILPTDTKNRSNIYDDGSQKMVESFVEQYRPKFAGAYQSATGVSFNIYAATQEGQPDAADKQYQVNPESVEFMMQQIETNIKNAPEGPTKHAIISNLEAAKSGKAQRVIDLIIDMSPTGGCLSPEAQMITALENTCQYLIMGQTATIKGGGLFDFGGPSGQKEWPIAVAAGIKYVQTTLTAEQQQELNKRFNTDGLDWKTMGYKAVRDEAKQQTTVQHELVHALGEGDTDNSYTEGDPDHEITGWLLGESYGTGKFDFKGATAKSPEVYKKITALVEAGKLPPILTETKP